MKNNTLYNEANNLIYVKSDNDKIFIICKDMSQVDSDQKRMHKHGNLMVEFEEWDEGEDKKYIVTFAVAEEPVLN